MEIKRIGDRTFLIKGKKEAIVVNPGGEGLAEQYKPRILIFTNKRQLPLTEVERITIAGGGEYEIGGAEILGINVGEKSVIYSISMDGMTIGLLGELEEGLTDKKIERIGAVDVLLAELCSGVEPKVVMGWAKKWGANYLIPMGQAGEEKVTKLLDLVDREGIEPIETLKLERDELPEGLEVVVIK